MSRLTPEERRLIDQAVADGQVTRCATGASAFAVEYRWCDSARTLVPVDPDNRGWAGGASFNAFHSAQSARVKARRALIMRLMEQGLSAAEISARLSMSINTVYDDARKAGHRFRAMRNGAA